MIAIKRQKELIVTGAAFTFFLLLACYKLTNASLWFDETIEYWYSKILVGNLPYAYAEAGRGSTMYERIISTYQPPLYNILMYFWLKINDSEWWFRFFGVVMGFLAMIGIYKSVNKLSNPYLASLAVFFSSTIYKLVYFWQECAEYCLMLATLCWAIYFWIALLQKVDKRNIILFTIAAIFPVYSQYGAAFPVLGMILVATVVILLKKDKKDILIMSASYIIALVAAAIPLYFLFIKKQIIKQQGGAVGMPTITFSDGFLKDIFNSIHTTFRDNLFPSYNDASVRIFLIIALVLMIVSLIFGKIKTVKWIILANIAAYFCYYLAVKAGLYSYGQFGGRYGLFFIPAWIILNFAIGIDIFSLLATASRTIFKWRLSDLRYIFIGVCLCQVLCYAINSWTNDLQDNWLKEDIRGVVNEWYEQDAYHSPTLVYYGADSGFAYYVRQNENYNESMESAIHYMQWYRNKSVDEYTSYLDSVYGDTWPEDIYIVASHTRDDLDTLIESFISRKYTQEELYNYSGGKLIRVVYQEGINE